MTPEHFLSIAQIVVTLISMFVGPWWAVQRSLRQFRSQKLWERQEQIYSDILSSLSVMKAHLDQAFDRYVRDSQDSGPLQIYENFAAGKENLRQRAAAGAFLITEDAAQALQKFFRQYDEDTDSAYESLDSACAAVDECIKTVRAEALKALNT